MASELDQRFDQELERIIGPGGRLVIGKDELGRAVVENLPGTLPEFFRTFCALNADNEAVVAGDERLSFAELDRLSDKVAYGLVARGIRKGDRVGIAMRNCPGWIAGYMGTLKAGGVATLLNGWWQAAEMEHAIHLTDPKVIIADTQRGQRIKERCNDRDIVIVAAELPVAEALSGLIDDANYSQTLPTIAASDDATILFTSGSTGDAKGAVSTHAAVTTATYSFAAYLMVALGLLTQEGRAPTTPPRTLLSVPLFHVTGEVPVLLVSFVIGRCMVIMPKWDAAEALRLIEKEKITYFVGVPTMSHELMNHPDRRKYDLSSLKDIGGGGAPRPASHVPLLQQEFPGARLGLGYGLTETNAVGCLNFWGNYVAKPRSTGRASRPLTDVAIFAPDDRHLGINEVGEIGIRSAANVRCYWHNPEATEALFTSDHFVRTGDVGYLDEDGYLFIIDRKKDTIIRGGENISAAEVEAELYACPAIGEAAVFGVADERLGEIPVAIVHCKSALTEDELRLFLDSRLAKFKVPERIVFAEASLPRLGSGKIDRRTLKAQYAR